MTDKEMDHESYTIRYVASIDDLTATLTVLGAQFDPPLTAEDRVFPKLFDHYDQDRRLMLVTEKDGQIVGGAVRSGSTLRGIALKPEVRGKGLGRRLIETFEVCAMRHGVRTISLGAVDDAKGFYKRLGHRGTSSMHKHLPLPGRVLAYRLQKLEARIGDLEAGQVVQTDETGKIPCPF